MPKYTWIQGDLEISKKWNLEAYLKSLGLPNERVTPTDILIIDCPRCGAPSYYDGGFTDFCSCCGFYNLADYSDDAYLLSDYWDAIFDLEEIFGKDCSS